MVNMFSYQNRLLFPRIGSVRAQICGGLSLCTSQPEKVDGDCKSYVIPRLVCIFACWPTQGLESAAGASTVPDRKGTNLQNHIYMVMSTYPPIGRPTNALWKTILFSHEGFMFCLRFPFLTFSHQLYRSTKRIHNHR